MNRLNNLAAELSRSKIKISDVSKLLGVSPDTVRNKINGRTEFTIGEAIKIQEKFFPDIEMLTLYASEQGERGGERDEEPMRHRKRIC